MSKKLMKELFGKWVIVLNNGTIVKLSPTFKFCKIQFHSNLRVPIILQNIMSRLIFQQYDVIIPTQIHLLNLT